MSLKGLIEHLDAAANAEAIRLMQKHICGDSGYGPCVYYIASLTNARCICESGSLSPRNKIDEVGTDLSATGVQLRRGSVWLGDGSGPKHPPKDTHDCLNFFFNPTNPTMDAFCRNQLILEGQPLKVVIFEFPLIKIEKWARSQEALWACTQKNIAKGGFTESRLGNLKNNFSWDRVFSVLPKDHFDEKTSGEFLMWVKHANRASSADMPVQLARRVLVPAGVNGEFCEIPRATYLGFKDTQELLRAEGHLQRFLHHQKIVGLMEAARSFEESASRLPFGPTLEHFKNQEIGRSYLHGIPHVVRVMFWCHVLTGNRVGGAILDDFSDPEVLKYDSMLAALLHDLCRESHEEDCNHGEAASEKFAQVIRQACDNSEPRIERISQAVTYHCKPDDEYDSEGNPIYRILKDADALDRGRFSGPCDGRDYEGSGCGHKRCEHEGCAYRTLRLGYDDIYEPNRDWPFRKNLSMAAWNVAQATRTAPWDFQNPAGFLTNWLMRGQEALLRNQETELRCSISVSEDMIF